MSEPLDVRFHLKCAWWPDGSSAPEFNQEYTQWVLKDATGRTHARAYRDHSRNADPQRPFLSSTRHTEDSKYCETLDEAKAHAEKHLIELFAALAPAFDCTIRLPGKAADIIVEGVLEDA